MAGPVSGRALGRQAQRRGSRGHVYAALDLGTNNCRLLVARPAGDGFRIVDAFSRIVRLGEGLDQTGRLSRRAMDRTIEALKVCADKMRANGVDRARCVATAACRHAANCDEFLTRVEAETGIRLDIISADEEARLAMDGCTSLLDPAARRALVFDIGGGSTELIWLERPPGRAPAMLGWTSLGCGVVTLAERYGKGRIGEELYRAMRREVGEMLAPFERAHRFGDDIEWREVQMLGTSGTVTTVAGVHLDLPRYDRARVDGLWLEADAIRAVARRLAAMDLGARARHPCIGRGRADLVVAGCAVLEAIMETWPVPRVRVADRGVREGILRDLVAADRPDRAQAHLVN